MKDKRPGVVTIAILTALTSILWVFFSVYSALTKEPAPQVSEEILEPIDPNLDLETLNKIRDGLDFDETDEDAIIANSPGTVIQNNPEQPVEELIEEETSNPDGIGTQEGDSSSEDFGVPEEDLQQ